MVPNNTLRYKIIKKFHSQAAFAKLTKIDPGTISRLIHGKSHPTARQLDFITTLLDTTKKELFPHA